MDNLGGMSGTPIRDLHNNSLLQQYESTMGQGNHMQDQQHEKTTQYDLYQQQERSLGKDAEYLSHQVQIPPEALKQMALQQEQLNKEMNKTKEKPLKT